MEEDENKAQYIQFPDSLGLVKLPGRQVEFDKISF